MEVQLSIVHEGEFGDDQFVKNPMSFFVSLCGQFDQKQSQGVDVAVVWMAELNIVGIGEVVQERLFVQMWKDDELTFWLWDVVIEETMVFIMESIGEVLSALVLIFTGGGRHWEYMVIAHIGSWLSMDATGLEDQSFKKSSNMISPWHIYT